jgi:homoserine dehydrogenase
MGPVPVTTTRPAMRETDGVDDRVRVGVLGCGHVGGALVRLIHENADVLARAGVRIEVTRVAVRDLTRPRDLPLPAEAFTSAASIVSDPDSDVVVSHGGHQPALVTAALAAGKPVVRPTGWCRRETGCSRPPAGGRRHPLRRRWAVASLIRPCEAGQQPHPPSQPS